MDTLQIDKNFSPLAAIGVPLIHKETVDVPGFVRPDWASFVRVPLRGPERSVRGPELRRRLGHWHLMPAAVLAALVDQPGQERLERHFRETGGTWAEALGTVYHGQLYGPWSLDLDYVLIAARRPTGRWHLWFRMLDDPRAEFDYPGVLAT